MGEGEEVKSIYIDELQTFIKSPRYLFRCQIGDHPIEDGEEVFIAKRQVGSTVQSEVLCAHHHHLIVSLSHLAWRRL